MWGQYFVVYTCHELSFLIKARHNQNNIITMHLAAHPSNEVLRDVSLGRLLSR